MNKSDLLEEVSESVKDKILTLPLGSSSTIMELVKQYFMDRNYDRMHDETKGWGFSKDHGKTFVCLDNDLFTVMDMVDKKLKGYRVLDQSKYFGMIVGLPYNIPFVIREDKHIVLVRIESHVSRSPRCKEWILLDKMKDHFIFRDMYLGFLDEVEDSEKIYSIPYSVINRVKKRLEDPVLKGEPEEIITTDYLDYVTMDGDFTSVELRIGDKYPEFNYYVDEKETVRNNKDLFPVNSRVIAFESTVKYIQTTYCKD